MYQNDGEYALHNVNWGVDVGNRYRIAMTGDSGLDQAGRGEAAWRRILRGHDLTFYAVGGKPIGYPDARGLTAVENVRRAGRADLHVIPLGSNGHRDGDELNRQWINDVMDAADGPVLWVGISQSPTYNPSSPSSIETRRHWNEIAREVVESRGGVFLDWDTAAAGRGLWAKDGVHMTRHGYRIKNRFMAAAIREQLASIQLRVSA